MSKIETNTIAPSTGTTLTLGESGDTIALGSGISSISGLSAGITNSQVWLLTSNLSTTGDSSFADITANLSESTLTGYGRLGSAMSVSSGVFTFPSTGYWSIEGVYNFTGANGYGRGEIKVTTDNSSYSVVATSQEETDDQEYASFNIKAQIDVTDTSNVKVKFTQGGTAGTLSGSSSYWRTGFMFTRLGDT
jgi:hypothetical protein